MDVAGRNVLLHSDPPAIADAVAAACRLSDFGLAAPFGTPSPVVSIPWAPPEGILAGPAGRVASAPHDVWGIGCVGVDCLTGRAPWWSLRSEPPQPGRPREGGTRGWIAAVAAAVERGATPQRPQAAVSGGAGELWEAVCEPCLAADPARRPAAPAVQLLARAACAALNTGSDGDAALLPPRTTTLSLISASMSGGSSADPALAPYACGGRYYGEASAYGPYSHRDTYASSAPRLSSGYLSGTATSGDSGPGTGDTHPAFATLAC